MRDRALRTSGLGLLVVVVMVVAGCSEIPTSGPIERGDEVRAAVDEPAVRVLPRDPVIGQTQEEVVAGFLEASASFENDHEVARRFLSPDAAQEWNASSGVTVIDDSPDFRLQRMRGGVQLQADQVAKISADGALTPRGDVEIQRLFQLERVGDEWRITDLPQGLILDRIEVSLTYRAFNIYFMNPQGSLLVPDPVYLPLDPAGSATSLMQSLLNGPTRWLRPAVESMIPAGTSLVVDAVPNDNGVARVDLSAEFFDADVTAREQAAAQITETLLGLTSTVTGVAITVEGSPLQLPAAPSVMTRETWEVYDSGALSPALGALIVRSGVVRRITDSGSAPVEGALGAGQREVVAPSHSWDGGTITALNPSRTAMLVTHPFLSAGVKEQLSGRSFLPASIDDVGRVWAVDAGGSIPKVRVLGEEGSWQSASLRGFRGSLMAFRVSADGTRVAVVVEQGQRRDRRGELLVGRVVQRAEGLQVQGFRRIERTLVDVQDVSWADASSLVVLGAQAGSVLEPTVVSLNRTVTPISGSPAVDVTQVTAGPSLPVLAGTSADGIWAESGSVWVAQVAGRDPAYPG
ncbi:MAG: LpqB family beta-propeller domain-containing protein [Actinomycetia bacterium]|nr:LpqB family beta-propeller domain-containing protein [Actinomycetes bacterium]